MEKITHLWNVSQLITKLNVPQSRSLQTSYILNCKRLSYGQIQSQSFKPGAMCTYCGSTWNTIDYKIRIQKSKQPPKSIKKIINSMNTAGKRIPKVRATLGKKCMQNEMNKLVIKCSVCLESTKVSFTKPKREKIQKLEINTQRSHKRKKKRTKDKTAGLNISGTPKLDMENNVQRTKVTNPKSGAASSFITPTPKLKKLNIDRLKNIVNQGTTPPKGKSLHSFLTELC